MKIDEKVAIIDKQLEEVRNGIPLLAEHMMERSFNELRNHLNTAQLILRTSKYFEHQRKLNVRKRRS